jgi:hypothetical protein
MRGKLRRQAALVNGAGKFSAALHATTVRTASPHFRRTLCRVHLRRCSREVQGAVKAAGIQPDNERYSPSPRADFAQVGDPLSFRARSSLNYGLRSAGVLVAGPMP